MPATEGSYEALAAEYYDASLHPTCAAFRAASVLLLARLLDEHASPTAWICEIGAGRSVVAELLESTQRLLVLDSSPSMLAYSVEAGRSQHHTLAEAEALPLANASVGVVAAVLGDPYNDAATWAEIARVLAPGGIAIYTAPAHEWSEGFRAGEDPRLAEFQLHDGSRLCVPSVVLPDPEQIALAEHAGLVCREAARVHLHELDTGERPPKLRGDRPIVSGFVFTRH